MLGRRRESCGKSQLVNTSGQRICVCLGLINQFCIIHGFQYYDLFSHLYLSNMLSLFIIEDN